MSTNYPHKLAITALIALHIDKPGKPKQLRRGLMLTDETPCLVCGGPVADINDKFCSKKCVAIKNGEGRKRSPESKNYYEANKESILAKLRVKRAKA